MLTSAYLLSVRGESDYHNDGTVRLVLVSDLFSTTVYYKAVVSHLTLAILFADLVSYNT